MTKEILLRTRKLLANKKRWTRHAFAKDKKGAIVPPDSPRAVCWCLSGAIRKAAADLGVYDIKTDIDGTGAVGDVTSIIANFLPESAGYYIPTYNDARGTRHSAVLSKIDKAIASLVD